MSTVQTTILVDEPQPPHANLFLPRTAVKRWGLTAEPVDVQFGQNVTQARVKGEGTHHVARLRPRLAEELGLHAGFTVQWRFDTRRKRLMAGPLIGVLLSHIDRDQPTIPFRRLTPFLNELADLCRRKGGVICAFTMDDVNWEARTLRGLVRQKGRWRPHLLPLPNCIYNRLASRQTERTEKAEDWLDRCQEHQIPFFNEQFLNKWHVHKALSGDEEAAALLPETIRFQSGTDLEAMIQQHPILYAKPVNGSMGKGIYRIQRGKTGYYLVNARSVKRYPSLSKLTRDLTKRLAGKNYLLQQGLRLIGIGNRPADFRAQLQKNRRGEWTVSSIVARLGANRVTSNVARGGTMMSARQALAVCGPWRATPRPTADELKKAALTVARAVERKVNGHYAELGVDLGVDIQGRIWLLEVNSKPSKTVDTLLLHPGLNGYPRRPRPSARLLYDYASFVSGFPAPPHRKRTQSKPGKRR